MAEDFVRPCRVLRRNTVEFAVPVDAVNGDLSDIEYLGGGSFGNVIKIPRYYYKGQVIEVAVKKLYEPLRDATIALRVYRELRLLQMMEHENVVRLVDLYTPDKSPEALKSVYIVTEYAGLSIFTIMKRQQDTGMVQLTPVHHQFIIYQLLRALKYIHSANVIHRDLKPSNLALTSDCDLTVLDFGQARTMNNNGDKQLTAYVMTRWYRSPEVMYWKIGAYDQQADMWSVGCILAELGLRRVLFQGDDLFSQYESIAHLCGSPDEILMGKIRQNEAVYNVLRHHGNHARKHFADEFPPEFSPELIDFLERTLVLDPERRMTVEEGLAHPYLQEYSMPSDEPIAPGPFVIETEDDHNRTLREWKEIIWQELQHYNPNSLQNETDVVNMS